MIHKIGLIKDLVQQFLLLSLQAIKGFALLFLLTSRFLQIDENQKEPVAANRPKPTDAQEAGSHLQSI
jgi:hypothetical protein